MSIDLERLKGVCPELAGFWMDCMLGCGEKHVAVPATFDAMNSMPSKVEAIAVKMLAMQDEIERLRKHVTYHEGNQRDIEEIEHISKHIGFDIPAYLNPRVHPMAQCMSAAFGQIKSARAEIERLSEQRNILFRERNSARRELDILKNQRLNNVVDWEETEPYPQEKEHVAESYCHCDIPDPRFYPLITRPNGTEHYGGYYCGHCGKRVKEGAPDGETV